MALKAAMEVAYMGCYVYHNFAFGKHLKAQYAVGRGVLRPHVEYKLTWLQILV
jgi:hypothetical protein